MTAQTQHGFSPIAVEQDFNDNGFNWFRHALLLAAGDQQQSNAMTIGWGGIGTLWRKTAVTVYVAEKRHTKQFMDGAQYFTVMAFSDRKDEIMEYMGTRSGRDGDKAKALNLHTAYTENGAPYYIEADMVLECRTMYAAPFDPQHFTDAVPKQMYANFPAGLHTMYIGEVVNAWKKTGSSDIQSNAQTIRIATESDNIYTSVDQMPTFPGGTAALRRYINSHMKASEAKGTVVVQFVVQKNGQIGKVKVVRSIPELDKEIVRVVESLPRFAPGRKDGRAVDVWYTLPISFD